MLGVLAAGIASPEDMSELVETLSPSDFYAERHRWIYDAALSLYARGEPVEIVMLQAELERSGRLQAIGGIIFLAELMDATATGANVMYHARIVVERARLRRLIDVGRRVIHLAQSPGESTVEEICDEAGRVVLEAVMSMEAGGLKPIRDDMYSAFEDIDVRHRSGDGITGLATGFTDLDNMTGGLQRGDLILLAARPSVGKTSLAVQVAMNAAISRKVPVAVFSIEMSRRSLFYRMLCTEAFVDLGRLLRGKLHDDDFGRLGQAAQLLKSAPIWVDDSATLSVMQLRARARRLKLEMPDLGLIVVDYLQKMHGPGENRTQEITGISGGLKAVAKELDVPLLALSQLTRGPDQRTEHRPQLSDLRESGSLEQDSDVVMFLYRPDRYDKEATKGDTELIMSKQRNGPIGTIEMFFREECTRFEDKATWGNR